MKISKFSSKFFELKPWCPRKPTINISHHPIPSPISSSYHSSIFFLLHLIPHHYLLPHHKGSQLAAMEHQISSSPPQKIGRPLPKRGQIKAQIFGSLVRSLFPKSPKQWKKKNKQEGGRSASTTPPLSGYTSDASSDT